MSTQIHEITNKLFECYVIQTTKYLIQFPKRYAEFDTNKVNSKTGKNYPKLSTWQMEQHLSGTKTVGVFAGKFYTKFITFDVDYQDPNMAKWITYKISYCLNEIGIHEHYISYSGNKGYHLDIYVDDLISIEDAQRFYQYVLEQSGVYEYCNPQGDKVEFRPTDGQGVKIPLGVHQATGKFCGFCDIEDGLSVMDKEQSYKYFLFIKKIHRQHILDIFTEDEFDDEIITKIPPKKDIIETEKEISKHKELPIYNQTEDMSIDNAIDILTNGIKHKGSRHNCILLIAKYLKYTGLDETDTKGILIDWMNTQDKNLYSTDITDCHKDIKEVVTWVYEKDVSIKPIEKNIKITLPEINSIIFDCPEKNQKIIMYSMLIHSKRFANMQGVFYMTYKQIEEATGLVENTLIAQIKKLEKLGVLEVIQRNKKQKGTFKKLPNRYKVTLNIHEGYETNTYITDQDNDLHNCLVYFYSNKELKKMLPKRQYYDLVA